MAGPEGNIREAAYRYIQRKILSGELGAGDLVSESSLAKELGSSRTPVREAIGQLAAEGLLEQIPARGTVVVQLSRSDIVDLYELREALEVYAVSKVARDGLVGSHIGRLREYAEEPLRLCEELERSGRLRLDGEQMQRFMAADLAFHSLLIRCAGNRRILKVLSSTRLLIRIFSIHRQGHDSAQLRQIYAYHSGILDAVLNRRPEEAARLETEHIRASCQERLEAFDDWRMQEL